VMAVGSKERAESGTDGREAARCQIFQEELLRCGAHSWYREDQTSTKNRFLRDNSNSAYPKRKRILKGLPKAHSRTPRLWRTEKRSPCWSKARQPLVVLRQHNSAGNESAGYLVARASPGGNHSRLLRHLKMANNFEKRKVGHKWGQRGAPQRLRDCSSQPSSFACASVSRFSSTSLLRYAAAFPASTAQMRRLLRTSNSLVAISVRILVHNHFPCERAVDVDEIPCGEHHSQHPPDQSDP
jgi:hypothetical protein